MKFTAQGNIIVTLNLHSFKSYSHSKIFYNNEKKLNNDINNNNFEIQGDNNQSNYKKKYDESENNI